MKNKIEAKKFIEEQLDEIYYIYCYINSKHGINIGLFFNTNYLDLTKKNPCNVFGFRNKEKKVLMSYYKRINTFAFSYKNIWSKLKKEFELSQQEIECVTKKALELHFNFKTNTPEHL